MQRMLLLLLLLIGAPLHAQSVQPQFKIDRTGTTKTVTVRDPQAGTDIVMGRVFAGSFNLGTQTLPQAISLPTLAPTQYPGIQGSLGNGGAFLSIVRTGGFGAYGYDLTTALITAPTPSPQFDAGKTAWVTSTNLTGGSVFGAWFGANTPSSDAAGQTYTGGAAIGLEVNAAMRWSEAGLQNDVGGPRYTVGVQVVPDNVPAADVAQTSFFHGTFGLALLKSQNNQKWWTGSLTGIDAIAPAGYGRRTRGGSISGNAPAAMEFVDGFWAGGINFSQATFSAPVIIAATGQKVCFNTTNACVLYASGKLQYQINGVAVMSVSDTGNAVFAGTVTQSGTP